MKFKTIVCDAPWPYRSPRAIVGLGGYNKHKRNLIRAPSEYVQVSVADKYNVMSIEDISNLKVADIADSNAHLYMWTTASFMCEAHDIIKKWKFSPKQVLVWGKLKKTGNNNMFPPKPSMSVGYWYRSACEFIIFGVRGKLRLKTTAPTLFLHKRLPHSVKPESFYTDVIEQQSPGPYLEMFARKPRDGWVTIGKDIDGKDISDSLKELI